MKTCSKCGETKALSEFFKNKDGKDGRRSNCKVCSTEVRDKWRQKNKERVIQNNAELYQATKELRRVQAAKWARENKASKNFSRAKRRAAKLQATPAWADQEKIKEIYNRASRANSFCEKYSLKVRFHVDHIVPLQGNEVSGLHVEDNLQVITAKENLKKHNKFEVE